MLHEDIIEDGTFIFFALDENGRVRATNPYTETVFSFSLIGKLFDELIIDLRDTFSLKSCLDKGDHSPIILNLDSGDGIPQSFLFRFYSDEEFTYAVGQVDVAEMRLVRRELIAHSQEITNLTRDLQKKNALLAELNDEKNRFLGMASHDLRRPIGLIKTYAEFLLDEATDVLTEEHCRFLEVIRKYSASMKQIVDDFLDVSIIESGKFELRLTKGSIKEALIASIDLNSYLINRKELEIQLDFCENEPELNFDRPKLEQAFANILSNAIESCENCAKITLRTTCTGNEFSIFFKDGGCGISAEELQLLFEPYLSTKKNSKQRNSGLGLLITKKIVEAHGGKLMLASKVGSGTTVSLTLPID